MTPWLLRLYLNTLEDVIVRIERAAYVRPRLRKSAVHLTVARGEIQAARHDLPARRTTPQGRGR